jgi:catechol 2,3-dioxygenase-like lactoylglutathione lyase family enzyme
MIVGMFHSSYTVSSLERAIAFYGGTLGIEHTHTQVSDQPYLAGVTGLPGCSLLIGFARVEGDTFAFEVIEYVHPKGVWAGTGFGRVGTLHTCWAVDNISAVYERLLNHKVTFLAEPHLVGDGLWNGGIGTFLLDPDGLLVELFEPAGASGGSGRLTGIHHTTLIVSDLDTACDLLCGKLGLELTERQEGKSDYAGYIGRLEDTHLRAAYLAIPNTHQIIQLWEFRSPMGPPAQVVSNNVGSGHICFVLDDLIVDYGVLTAQGVHFVGQPTEVTAGVNKGARATYLIGPDNVRFEIFQRPS